jgi:hypothetical protein
LCNSFLIDIIQEIDYRKEEEKKESEIDIEEAIAIELQGLVKKSMKVKVIYSSKRKASL